MRKNGVRQLIHNYFCDCFGNGKGQRRDKSQPVSRKFCPSFFILEGVGEAIYFDDNFRVSGIIAENPEISLELAVKPIRFQSDDYFSLPAGLDVRIIPHNFHTSSVFYFGNGEKGISGIGNLEYFFDDGRSSGQIPRIIIIRRNGNRGAC